MNEPEFGRGDVIVHIGYISKWIVRSASGKDYAVEYMEAEDDIKVGMRLRYISQNECEAEYVKTGSKWDFILEKEVDDD